MRALWYGLTLLAVLLLQTSPLLTTVGSGWRVDLVLLVVVYLSLFWNGQRVLILGFLAGVSQDALSSEVLGLNALSKTLTVFVVQTLCRNVQVHSLIAQALFTALGILIDTLSRGALLLIFQLYAFEPRLFLLTLVQQTVLSLIIMPVVYRGLDALGKGLGIHQGAR